MYLEISHKLIAEITQVDEHTIGDHANLIRKELSQELMQSPVRLGENDAIVQIDESVIAKAKLTRNGHARQFRQQWVFGLYDSIKKLE